MAEEAAAGKPAVKPRVIGRYALFGEIAAGGMATVHFGRLVGPVGFSRTVAIKRLHPQYAKDPEFVGMFLDEARLASRIQHPNVVTTLDVVNMPNEVFLVMEYVEGESLSRLVRNARKQNEKMPPGHVAAVMSGMLHGLHAAHEAKSERREPLNIVHRDISPQNVLVGVDGVARVLDFGVAKAALRSQSTRDGQMKGKLSYMSPEQLNGKAVDRRTDIFAAGVVLWEALAGKRLFDGSDAGEIFGKVLASEIPQPRDLAEGVTEAMNAVVLKALERDPVKRYQTAREFAIDLEASIQQASGRAVGEWVERFAGPDLERRSHLVGEIEGISTSPEDLAKLEEEQGIETLEGVEESPRDSAVLPASGSRPRLPPPPKAPTPRPASESEERSVASVVTGGSTSKVTSLAIPQPAEAQKSRSNGVLIGAVAACLGGGVLAFLVFGHGGSDATPAPGAAPPPAASVATAAPATPAAPPTPTLQVGDLPKEEAPDDGLEITTVTETGSAKTGGTKGRWTPPKAAKPAKPAAPNCNPPYSIDANGIKRVKPGCF